jgi:N6-L-threonylcarbamoyladenine synthase
MLWLGIETSCDETAVALVQASAHEIEILRADVGSQITKHRPFGGVVPELAVREHLRDLPRMVPDLMRAAGVDWAQIEGIAVTQGPGLAACLMIGYSYAQGLGLALGRPVCGVNHLEGHLLSPFLNEASAPMFPFIGLIVSGGHTLLVRVNGWGDYERLGGTVDDAAGEVFDKVARLLGLSYPGGPEIERLAHTGNPRAYEFPQSFPERDNFNFSFSGLKTSVRYFLEKNESAKANPPFIHDVCASFQEAVVQVLTRKALRAARSTGCRMIAASGGVLGNGALRAHLAQGCAENGITLRLAPNDLCTDNAAMIAAAAAFLIRADLAITSGQDINPNLRLGVERAKLSAA